ncbi:MAG: Clp protease N-terminal domain-containing protein, partial [Sphaerospermopsis kisseleviana]
MQPTDPNKFTDTAWDAVIKSQDIVRAYQQQQLEVEHLILALLEESSSVTSGILARAEIDPIRLQEQLEGYTK